MRPHAKGALLFLVSCLAVVPAMLAQEERGSSNADYPATRKAPDVRPKPIVSRLLTPSDGLAILGAALDSHRHAGSTDCSHLIHELYGRAGFPYEYASSSDLYTGIDEFRRVSSPQPGDLAVWRGHAGIVINPPQHSFFSVLSSGPGVDSYDSPYWKQRGRPRFFRYARAVPGGVLSASIGTASLKATGLGNNEPHEPAARETVPAVPEESSGETWSSIKLSENQPGTMTTPRVPIVNSARPSPDEVSAAFLEACNEWEESLRGRDLFNSAQSLVVFGHFEVKKVRITGNEGWAEVHIDELASLTGSNAEAHKRSERQRWRLSRRNNRSWELTLSPTSIYLPQNLAERILAHELARLTEDSPNTASRAPEKAELARLLDALLKK